MKLDFEKAFAALPGAFMVLDRNLCYVAASDAYCTAVMRCREDLMGKNLFDLFPNEGESGRRLKASFRKVLATGEPDTLAYIPYDLPRPEAQGGGLETRFWSASHMPILGEDGSADFVLQQTTDVTELVRLREMSTLPFRAIPAELDLVARTQQVEEAHRQATEESERFKRLFQEAPGIIAVMSGPEHIFTFANNAYTRLIGGREVVGRPVAEALPEVVGQGFVTLLDKVFHSGERYSASGTRVLLEGGTGELDEHFLDFTYEPIRDAAGTVTGIFVQGMDTTQSTRAKHRQAMLVNELNHRVKNTLAAVQSIAQQTFRPGSEVTRAKEAFQSRIAALSKTHTLLSEREWTDASIRSLLDAEFAAYGSSRVVMSGPAIQTSPKAAIAMTLILHEMATNAGKYGALSSDDGRVRLDWHFEQRSDDRWLRFLWQEEGGPSVTPPRHRGFGTRLIETVVRGELGGEIDLAFAEAGLVAELAIPVRSFEKRDESIG